MLGYIYDYNCMLEWVLQAPDKHDIPDSNREIYN